MNILVAEDNEFTARQYKLILEKNGHRVVTARDGSECVKKYKEIKEVESKSSFDIVVLDHNVPRKAGTRVAKEILAKNPNRKSSL
jgi:CheY-like chemotaxis protein